MIIIIIVIRKATKYLMNFPILGSEDMYQIENSVMDHVMNRATGMKVKDSVSSVIVILMFSVGVVIMGVNVIVNSLLLLSSVLRGIMLIINVNIRVYLILLILFLCRG